MNTSRVETRLHQLGLILPPPAIVPAGIAISFAWARVHRDRVYLSGHGPQTADGTIAGPFGKVGAEVTPEQGYQAARLAAVALLASLKRAIGDLDRVSAWLMVSGWVNAAPGFTGTTNVVNGASDLILDLYGTEVGAHARTAIGAAQLPLGCAVVVAAELAIER